MVKSLTVNSSGLRRKLKTLPVFARKQGFPILAAEAKKEIMETTAKRKSPDGTAYPDLTPQYAKRKQKIGEGEGALPVPNLRLKNELLNSMGYDASRQLLTVPEKQMPKARGVSSRRRFLVASKKMALRAMPALRPALQKFLR